MVRQVKKQTRHLRGSLVDKVPDFISRSRGSGKIFNSTGGCNAVSGTISGDRSGFADFLDVAERFSETKLRNRNTSADVNSKSGTGSGHVLASHNGSAITKGAANLGGFSPKRKIGGGKLYVKVRVGRNNSRDGLPSPARMRRRVPAVLFSDINIDVHNNPYYRLPFCNEWKRHRVFGKQKDSFPLASFSRNNILKF